MHPEFNTPDRCISRKKSAYEFSFISHDLRKLDIFIRVYQVYSIYICIFVYHMCTHSFYQKRNVAQEHVSNTYLVCTYLYLFPALWPFYDATKTRYDKECSWKKMTFSNENPCAYVSYYMHYSSTTTTVVIFCYGIPSPLLGLYDLQQVSLIIPLAWEMDLSPLRPEGTPASKRPIP